MDDDPFLASTLGFALQRNLPPDSTVRRAHSVEEARQIVECERFDAVVTDHCMTDGVGTELLDELLRRGSDAPRLFLVSGANPDEIEVGNLLRRHPEITFIEKPFVFDVVARRVREAILPDETGDGGYYGLELFDLVQAYHLAHKSATLRVFLPDARMGTVVLFEGELIHAALGTLTGPDALLGIIRHRKSPIRIEETCTTALRTIEKPTQYVLIDTLRRLDEEMDGKRADDAASPLARRPEPAPRSSPVKPVAGSPAASRTSVPPLGPPPSEGTPMGPGRYRAPAAPDTPRPPSAPETPVSSARASPSTPWDFGPLA